MPPRSPERRAGTALLTVLGVYVAGAGIAVIGYHAQWGTFPEFLDAAFGLTLCAPFAIPKAFGDLVGLTARNSTRGFIPMMVVYWPMMFGLMVAGFKLPRGRLAIVAIIGGVAVASSIKWLVVAVGMLGL